MPFNQIKILASFDVFELKQKKRRSVLCWKNNEKVKEKETKK